MHFNSYAPCDNYPKNLNRQQIIAPIGVITDFFSVDFIEGHSSKLANWRYYVVHDKAYKDERHGPGSLLFTYDLHIGLLEAAYLLHHDYYNLVINSLHPNEQQLAEERMRLRDFPTNLKLSELLNPYKALKNIFKNLSLQQYRDYLHEWLYAALYIRGGSDELTTKEIDRVYKNILKLYSATWLIYQREVVK